MALLWLRKQQPVLSTG